MSLDEASRQPASPQGSLLVRYPLTSFFVMPFAFSWLSQNRRMSLWTTRGCAPPLKRSSIWRWRGSW